MNQYKIYGALVLSMIFWSLSFVWYKEVFPALKPLSVVFFRLIISSIIVYAYAKLVRRFKKMERKDIRKFILLAFFEPFLYFLGESNGMVVASATTGAVIISTIPLFAPVAAYFFLKERLTPLNYFGLFFSFLGVMLVVFNGSVQPDIPVDGVLLLFLAVFAAVGYSIVLGKLSAHYNPLSIIIYQNLIGVVFFLPLFLWLDLSDIIATGIDPSVILPLFELAIFASSLAFILFTYGVRTIGVSKANMFSNLIPVFTAIFAFIMLGESLTMQKIAGVLVAVGGVYIGQFNLSKLRNKRSGNIPS